MDLTIVDLNPSSHSVLSEATICNCGCNGDNMVVISKFNSFIQIPILSCGYAHITHCLTSDIWHPKLPGNQHAQNPTFNQFHQWLPWAQQHVPHYPSTLGSQRKCKCASEKVLRDKIYSSELSITVFSTPSSAWMSFKMNPFTLETSFMVNIAMLHIFLSFESLVISFCV